MPDQLSKDETVYFQIAQINGCLKLHEKEISELKVSHKEYVQQSSQSEDKIYKRINELKDEVHKMALSFQRWAITILMTIVVQSGTAVLVFILSK